MVPTKYLILPIGYCHIIIIYKEYELPIGCSKYFTTSPHVKKTTKK